MKFLAHDLGVHEGFESAKFLILFRGCGDGFAKVASAEGDDEMVLVSEAGDLQAGR